MLQRETYINHIIAYRYKIFNIISEIFGKFVMMNKNNYIFCLK